MGQKATRRFIENTRLSNKKIHIGLVVIDSDRVQSCLVWDLEVVSIDDQHVIIPNDCETNSGQIVILLKFSIIGRKGGKTLGSPSHHIGPQ